jgi:hypothetical protein
MARSVDSDIQKESAGGARLGRMRWAIRAMLCIAPSDDLLALFILSPICFGVKKVELAA